ncbi:MAG: nitrophenyl compound nitroreductase subunit ArsF family protein [Desulfobacterales bacterium]|nr:nitrophenyl compound nitroreductase subunit ArsF family protein [Desulfobacterales bacterium]
MKLQRFATGVVVAIALAVFAMLGGWPAASGPSAGQAIAAQTDEQPRFIAYYFYTSQRCGACYRLEQWTETAVKNHFQQEIEKGRLDWRTVSVDQPENRHFIKDFSLYTKSVVIVEQNNGETLRWKNLEKVWRLLRNQEKYADYVSNEIQAFMEKS